MLATIGAFRVVAERDLDDFRGSGRAQSGFTCIRGGRTSQGASPFDPRAAEDLI